MTKLSKSILKEIVKECIMEIFEESFFGDQSIIRENKSSRNKDTLVSPRKSSKKQTRNTRLDNSSYQNINESNERSDNNSTHDRFDKKIDKITSNITNDPIMANIFKDTASTTLQQQMETGKNNRVSILGSGDAAAKKAFDSDPTELFSESANKWAALAFSESIRK
jgi:hypothetical protein